MAIKYLSLQGNDTNDGLSESQAFRTFPYAFSTLDAGDQLIIKEGTYYSSKEVEEGVFQVKNRLTRNKTGIQIKGEGKVIIDGSIPSLENLSSWILTSELRAGETIVSSDKIYRSREQYSISDYNSASIHKLKAGGYFSYRNKNYGLVRYKDLEAFASDEQEFSKTVKYYAGPGLFYDWKHKYIYLRLDAPAADIVGRERTIDFRSLTDLLVGGSKLRLKIALGGDSDLQTIQLYNLEGFSIENIEFRNHGSGGVLGSQFGPVKDVSISNVKFYSCSSSHIGLKGENIEVLNCEFDTINPDWIAWNDVRTEGSTAVSMASQCLNFSSNSKNIRIQDCKFYNCFDGIDVSQNVSNWELLDCHFENIMDDSIVYGMSNYNVNIGRNTFKNVTHGVAILNGIGQPEDELGKVYIHHNLIVCVPVFHRRKSKSRPLAFTFGQPLNTTHVQTPPGKCPRKIYNNTIIMKGSLEAYPFPKLLPQYLGKKSPLIAKNERQEVYNNIFILDGVDALMGNRLFIRSRFQIFDGNIYYRTVSPLTSPIFRLDRGTPNVSADLEEFATLEAYKASSFFDDSKEVYGLGWENSGKEGNPQLNSNYIPAPESIATIDEIDLSTRTEWPDHDNCDFIGAYPPQRRSGGLLDRLMKFLNSYLKIDLLRNRG